MRDAEKQAEDVGMQSIRNDDFTAGEKPQAGA